MGLIEKIFGSKKDEGDKFWTETDYGFAPKESVKIRYSPDRDSYRGIGPGIIIDGTIEEYQRQKALDKKIFTLVPYLMSLSLNVKIILVFVSIMFNSSLMGFLGVGSFTLTSNRLIIVEEEDWLVKTLKTWDQT